MKSKLLPVLTFARIDIKRLFRDKVGIFFVFLFPLIFLLVFGGIFGRDSNISFNVALFNQSQNEASASVVKLLQESDTFKIRDNEDVATKDEALEVMRRGTIDAIITLPEDFGEINPETKLPGGQAEVLFNAGDDSTGTTLGSVMETMFAGINAELVPVQAPFKLSVESTNTEGLTSFDLVFSGLLGFSILSLGIFGPTTVFPRMKEKGILRRYHTTPIRVWQYFAGNVLSNAVIGLMATAFMFIVALTVFNLNMRGDYLSLLLLVILGVVVMFGIGLAAGGWAKNENQAAPLAQLVAFPMMFLSGVFFPRFLMPEWLQTLSGFLPLTPLVDGMRFVISEGQSIMSLGTEVGLLAIWAVIIYAIAFRVFRWE